MNNQTAAARPRGFTLSEVVMTTVIIGIVSTVTIPPILRIRMNHDVESVRQNMRIIGEKLTEIMGRERQFPPKSHWGNGAVTEDELSLTANLSAIDSKGYSTEDYFTDPEQTNYQFRSCPTRAGFGLSLPDTCFLVDSFGVREIKPWQGMSFDTFNFIYSGMDANKGGTPLWDQFKVLHADMPLVQALTESLEVGALNMDAVLNYYKAGCPSEGECTSATRPLFSFYMVMPAAGRDEFLATFEQAYTQLRKEGIDTFMEERTVDEALSRVHYLASDKLNEDLQTLENISIMEISFKVKDPVDQPGELLERVSKLQICQQNLKTCAK